MALEKLNTPLCYLVLSGSIVYAVLLYFFTVQGTTGIFIVRVSTFSLYHKASYHALFSDFVDVNKFEETCMITSILLASTKRPILVRCSR